MTQPTTQDDSSTNESEMTAGTPARSRRALMLGSAGAAAVLATGLAGPRSAQAADGDNLIIGRDDNVAAGRTQLTGPSFIVTDGSASGSLARNVRGTITGLHGYTAASSANRAVWGLDETAQGVGVYGQHGAVGGPGTGVVASSGNGVGIEAQGTTFDAALNGTGQLNMVSAGSIAADRAGPVGTLARSDDGSLWYSVGDNEWSRLAGRGRSSTFVPIEPTRVYDSRLGEPLFGAVPTGGSRRVSIRAGRDLATGAVTEPGLVPSDATAVSYNVTVARTVGDGFLTVAPGYATGPKASSVNWNTNGQTVANAGVVQVDEAGAVQVFVGGFAGASTDFLIDVTGYYS